MSESDPPVAGRNASRPNRSPKVLVVDDEADLRELLQLTLVRMGLDVDCAADLAQARGLIATVRYDLCLTDMRLPDGDGLSLVADLAKAQPNTPVAVITAYGSAESAVAALKAGAFDYVAKPVGLDALRALVRSALRLPPSAAAGQAATGVREAAASPSAQPLIGAMAHAPGTAPVERQGTALPSGGVPSTLTSTGVLIGDSPAMTQVRDLIVRLSRSMAPVSITGESGSGKELAARLIHQSGPRADLPFVAVNCGAIPEALMESEFFGHRRGAFTGADQDRTGLFQAASGGTLFLDEVADLPLPMQVKLLRAIQERRVRRIGSPIEEPVDVRIISATHQNLADSVQRGRFRQDLYYRLNVIELRMPALRERPGDIPSLADALLGRLARRAGLPSAPRLASVALRYLSSYSYPGNVRELENILERALAFSSGDLITVEDLGLRPAFETLPENELAAREDDEVPPTEPGEPGPLASDSGDEADGSAVSEDGIPLSLPRYLEWREREAIVRALERTAQNRTAAARLLGISFRALRHRMQRLNMQ
jgi:two-component system response regulator PilR (NtrC family)